MSIKDAISNALKFDPEELAASAHAKVQAARDKLTNFQVQETKITAALASIEGDIDAAASLAAEGGDRKSYEAAKHRRAQLRDELELTQAAQRRCANDLRDAEDALRRARTVDQLKTARRHANIRTKAAQKITDGIALFHEGWRDIHSERDKIVAWGGTQLSEHPGGLAIAFGEIKEMTQREMARQSMPLPLDGRAVPALPGTPSFIFDGDPKQFVSLVDAMTAANEFLLRRIEGVAAPAQQTEAPQSSTTNTEPNVQMQPADPAPQTFDAAQVLASIMPQKLKV